MADQLNRARQLHKAQTKAESRAWWLLRNRTLQGFKFRRQHPIGPFFADFCCAELKLVIELEGGVHSQPSIIRADASRDEFLRQAGYVVAYFPNGMILKAPQEFVMRVKNLCQELRSQV